MENFIRPELRSDWSSVVNCGMQLDISATIDGVGHQLLTIVADEQDESLWVQIHINGAAVQIPSQILRDALDAAIGEVHSENWYDKNLPPGREA